MQVSATFDTHDEARAWAADQEAKIQAGAKAKEGRVAFLTPADLFRRYAEEVSPTKRGERWEAIGVRNPDIAPWRPHLAEALLLAGQPESRAPWDAGYSLSPPVAKGKRKIRRVGSDGRDDAVLPSRSVRVKGSVAQSWPSTGTTSVWPDSMTPGTPAGPMVA